MRHAGCRGAPHRGAIADRVDREAEDVEADRDVADRGGRERRATLRAVAPRRCAHSRAPEIGRQPQQIGEYAAGGDRRARTRSLHDQRIVAVARGREAHHVVGQRDVGEGMALRRARSAPRWRGRRPTTAPT